MKALQVFLHRKRRRALLVYGLFAVLLLPLIIWLIVDFSTETQAAVFALLLLWGISFLFAPYSFHLRGNLSPLREGIVITKTTKKIIEFDPRPWVRVPTKLVAYLTVEVNGRAREVALREIELFPLFEEGDRILFSAALAAPLLLDRETEQYVCPFCGAILPRDPALTACVCGHPFLS